MAAVLALVLLSSCGLLPGRADGLGEIVLESGPPGHREVEATSGPMDLDAAAEATAADTGRLRTHLGRTGFQGGWARVWTREDGFVVVLAFEFLTEGRAADLVAFQATEHERKRGVLAFDPPDLPDGRGFVLTAQRRRGGTIYCQTVWFAEDRFAFEARSCSDHPGGPDLAAGMAQRQLALVREAIADERIR